MAIGLGRRATDGHGMPDHRRELKESRNRQATLGKAPAANKP